MPRFSSLKAVAAVLFAGCVLLVGDNRSFGQNPEVEKPPIWSTLPQREVTANDDELRSARILRYNAALREVEVRLQELEAGRITPDVVLAAGDRMRASALALCTSREERLVVHEQAVDFGKAFGKRFREKTAGVARVADLAMTRQWLADAEVRLLEEKQNKKPTP